MKKAILCFPTIENEATQIPTGLYKISDFCRSENDVIVLDQRLEQNIVRIIEKLIDENEILCLGISCMTGIQLKPAIEIAKHFRNRTKIVMGGIHPSIEPRSTLDSGLVDYVIIGEGEKAFLNLLRYLVGKQNFQKLFYTANDVFLSMST